jgi:hypothetical protein
MDKIKIGIVSENYRNDGEPIATLLYRYFPNHNLECRQLNTLFSTNKKGSGLDTDKFTIQLEAICAEYEPNFVLFVRDLDKDKNKKDRLEKFENNSRRIQPEPPEPAIICLHLLFIYEIEALALTDWETTKGVLEWKDKKQQMPKSVKAETKDAKGFVGKYFKYSEGGMKKLAEYFNLNTLKNYTVWSDFIEKISEKIE